MPILNQDTQTTVSFANDYDVWLVESYASAVVSGHNATAVLMGKDSGILENYGTLVGAGFGVTIGDLTYSNTVINESSGRISGDVGVYATNAHNPTVQNAGVIHGASEGVEFDDVVLAQLDNTGRIESAVVGVRLSDSYGEIDNSGVINGGEYGIDDGGTSSLVIRNSGVISAGYDSIVTDVSSAPSYTIYNNGEMDGLLKLSGGGSDVSSSSVFNSGVIKGDIQFANGLDLYDGRGGSIMGVVYGRDGADTLIGGSGDDTLCGGLARDRLDGGKGGGEDTFLFTDIKDSRPSAPDLIAKHWGPNDTLDVSLLDANTSAGGQQHLTWGGLVAPGASLAKGVVDYYQQNGSTYVVFDNTGDGQADFKLQIHGTVTVTADQLVV